MNPKEAPETEKHSHKHKYKHTHTHADIQGYTNTHAHTQEHKNRSTQRVVLTICGRCLRDTYYHEKGWLLFEADKALGFVFTLKMVL